jgi:hypothetical protein
MMTMWFTDWVERSLLVAQFALLFVIEWLLVSF